MRFLILDDDRSVVTTLKMIIEQQQLGTVTATAGNGQEALEELQYAAVDIVLVDFLMPVMDGVTFINKAREKYPNLAFIMLSFVTDEEMVGRAYQAGVEFYIHKPINSVEVLSVIQKVQRLMQLETTFTQMQQLMGTPQTAGGAGPEAKAASKNTGPAEKILSRIGIAGEPVSYEILKMVDYILSREDRASEPTVADLCAQFSDSPKALEQRIRRALVTGLENLANMGIEDYGNETFVELSGTLYNFKEVRQEMEYIRGKASKNGKVSVKKFLYALASMCNMHK